MNKFDVTEKRWMGYYLLLRKYSEIYGNVDVPDSYGVNGIMLGSWFSRQKQAYKNHNITGEKVRLLNDLNIDWSPKDTKILNQTITNLNIKKYNEVLLIKLDHILDDIQYEGFNEMTDLKVQKEINAILVKRIWR